MTKRFKTYRVTAGRSAAVRLRKNITPAGTGGRTLAADSAGRTSKPWSSVVTERVVVTVRLDVKARADFRRAVRKCELLCDADQEKAHNDAVGRLLTARRTGEEIPPVELAELIRTIRQPAEPVPFTTYGEPVNGGKFGYSAAYRLWGTRPQLRRFLNTIRSILVQPAQFGGDTHVMNGTGAGEKPQWHPVQRSAKRRPDSPEARVPAFSPGCFAQPSPADLPASPAADIFLADGRRL